MSDSGSTVAQAYVQIIPSADGIKGKITEALGGEATSAGKSAGLNIAGAIKSAIAAAGIGAAIKNAISEGADLEQSLGGVEAIFGDAADTVIANANQAFKTAGMSANQYMENVTSFSASLLQSLGGDTMAAASAADQAMQDMSDNANRFGTDMSSITNAYQGFAKDQYQLLDNLKLGYGGTKTEMERLLADAEKLHEEATGEATHYSIENLADVYAAIHDVQDSLNVTGTTAKEAASTLSGSFNMMKAAAADLMGNIALGNDLTEPLNHLTESIEAVVSNLFPVLGNIITSGVPALLAMVGDLAPSILQQVPEFVKNAEDLITNVLDQLSWVLPELITAFVGMIPSLIEQAISSLDQIALVASNVITDLASGLAEGIPQLLENILPLIMQLSESLRENAGLLVDAGLNLIIQLAEGLIAGLPAMIEYIPTIIDNIVNIVNDNMPKIIATGIELITMLANGIVEAVPVLIENLPIIIQTIWDFITAVNWLELGGNIIEFIGNGITLLKEAIPNLLKTIGEKGLSLFKSINWLELGMNVLTFIGNGILALIELIPKLLITIGQNAVSGVQEIDWLQLGKDMVQGIINGIKALAGAFIEAIVEMARSALDSVKAFFGIESPSKVMRDEVGKMIPAGLAVGIEANADSVTKAMDDLSEETLSAGIKGLDSPLISEDADIEGTDPRLDIIIGLLDRFLPECAQPVNIDEDSLVYGMNRRLGLGVV